jgi:hypothetical protein
MLIKIAAAVLLAAFLWTLFRFALGLRWAKVSRQAARREVEERGWRVVAELPLENETIELLLEDGRSLRWGTSSVAAEEIEGARLLLNGGVLAECARRGVRLPPPTPPEGFDGRERWEVALHVRGGGRVVIPCGTLREGVSRETAHAAYETARGFVAAGT